MNELVARNLVVESHSNKFGLVISQNQSRELKSQILSKVTEKLSENFDVEFVRTAEGYFMLIPNDNEGVIPVLLDVKMKPLDTDVDTMAEEYKQKQAEKEAKKKESKQALFFLFFMDTTISQEILTRLDPNL